MDSYTVLDKLVNEHIEMFALMAFEQYRLQGRGAVTVFFDVHGKHDAVHYVPQHILAKRENKLPHMFTFMVEAYDPGSEFVIIAETANAESLASTVKLTILRKG